MSNSEKINWVIDPAHSEIAFKVKHLMITNVKGVFKEFTATVKTAKGNFITSDVEFSLNPASVDTGAPDRDKHLRSADFFDVEKYGKISFKGKEVEKADSSGNYLLSGDLTIKDITRPVKLNVEFTGSMKDPWGNEKAGYSLTGKIDRKNWGLLWNAALEAGGYLLSDDVTIMCDLQLVKQS